RNPSHDERIIPIVLKHPHEPVLTRPDVFNQMPIAAGQELANRFVAPGRSKGATSAYRWSCRMSWAWACRDRRFRKGWNHPAGLLSGYSGGLPSQYRG